MERMQCKGETVAQIRWSERCVKEREWLRSDGANAVGETVAQIRWSERCVKEREWLRSDGANAV